MLMIPIQTAIKDAYKQQSHAEWVGDTIALKEIDARVKRLEAMAREGELYEILF